MPVAVLVGPVEEIDLRENHKNPVLERDAAIGRLHGAQELDLVPHQRGPGHVLHEDGDVDLVGERVLGVAPRLVRGRVDAGQIHQHHAGHRALDGDHHRDELDGADAGVGPVPVARVLERDERADLLGELVEARGHDLLWLFSEPGFDVGEPCRDVVELGERGLLAAPGAIRIVDLEALARLERALHPEDLRGVEPLPALDAARLERVEVARDPLLELVLAVVGDDRLELPGLARLDHRRAPGAALGLAREQLLALQPRREERALALLFQANDADLDDALGEPFLAIEAARAQILEAPAELAELARVVALGLEVAREPVGELAIAEDLVCDLAQLGSVRLTAFGAPHGALP